MKILRSINTDMLKDYDQIEDIYYILTQADGEHAMELIAQPAK
ncbi:hypothetical protein [Periweissella cryptocerci]|nr:hypothetical protein [Periweissella cryptocerci]